jgi:hypothetical protein
MTKKQQADAADDQVDAVDEDEDLDTMLSGGDKVQQAKEWFRREVRTRGLRVALNALIDVAADSKAPAPARATAGTSLMRAAGAFSKAEEEALEAKPLGQMSQAEMERELAKLRTRRLRNERVIRRASSDEAEDEGVGNVFD